MKFKLFQKQDLARAALHDGLILSWDCGLGKSLAAFAWPLLKVGFDVLPDQTRPKAPVLLIAPGDLHAQLIDEGWKHFRVKVTHLPNQDTFERLTRKPDSHLTHLDADSRPVLPAGFYLVSYTELTTNGVAPLPDPADCPNPRSLLESLSLLVGVHQDTVRTGQQVNDKAVYGWSDHPDFADVCQFFAWRGLRWADAYDRLSLDPDDDAETLRRAIERCEEDAREIRDPRLAAKELAKVQEAHEVLRHLFTTAPAPRFDRLTHSQQDFVIRHFLEAKLQGYADGMGETRSYPVGPLPEGFDPSRPETDTRPQRRVKCLYSPSLADLCYNAFDAVVIDEGVKMKGEDTLVGKGVRSMTPKYRLVLTATPVKNRLPDIFRLAWWATGGKSEAHARWPYRDDSSGRTSFAETFMVSERNVTKEEKAKEQGERVSSGRFKKLTAEVCNVHRLWKLLGPVVLRRRKQDAGEDIVPRLRKVVRCEMGSLQQRVYRYHLEADYRDRNGMPAIGAQLQALRMAAADPSSEHLEPQPGGAFERCPHCKGEGDSECPHCHGTKALPLPHRSGQAYIPKMASTLALIQEILERKEQVVVFSAFNDPLDNLGRWLGEAQVRYVKLDGRVSQKARGKLAAQFKAGRHGERCPASGPIPVMLAGVECMAEGHSFHLANNVILIAYSWAFDKFKQALDRVHRMTSVKPVNVYVVLCGGTIDARLESLIQEKGDAAELVLDGRLIGERSEEVNLAELLHVAQREFESETRSLDEALLHQEWQQSGRDRLASAMRAWDEGLGVPVGIALHTPATPPTAPAAEETAKPEAPVTAETPAPAPAWRQRMAERARKLQGSSLWDQL